MSARFKIASFSVRIRRAAAGLFLAAGAAAAPADAHRALLIGVGDYTGLDPSLALTAPGTDVARLAAALERAGLPRSAMTVMTERAGITPTRQAVLRELGELATIVVPGQQVLVYFSGHGTQAPARTPAREADGLDELYLMADASGWDGGLGRVPGAIDDVELAAALDAIRATGADVWLVADTCHAAGIYRAADAAGRTKAIPRERLGIPRSSQKRPSAAPRDDPAQRTSKLPFGRLAAFYAAGTDGEARERLLPPGGPGSQILSQFTYSLVRAIDGGRLRSLRDLAIAINAADANLGGDAPQPAFEGSLDMAVLGLAADRPRRWTIQRMAEVPFIAAGSEEGLSPGAQVTLRDGTGASIGHARVLESSIGHARLSHDRPDASEVEIVPAPIDAARTLIAALPDIAGGGAASGLQASAMLWRPGARRTCPSLDSAGPPASALHPMDLLAPGALGQCDVVLATFRNGGATAVDASPFYLAADGRLSALSYLDSGAVRIHPGETRRIAVRLLSEDRNGHPLPTGGEKLILVALPAKGDVPADLRGIAAATWRGGAGGVPRDGTGALVYRWTVTGRR